MKKIYLLIMLLVAAAAVRAQNSVVVKGSFDVALSGKTVWIDFYGPGSGCSHISNSTTTNSSGQYSYSLNLGTCSYGNIVVTTIGCASAYDTLYDYTNYDTAKNGDTIVFDFEYCDTLCRNFNANFNFYHWPFIRTADFYPYFIPGANKYTWKFGDGNTSNTVNPTHVYAASGNYNVWMIAEDTTKGCKDSINHYVYMPDYDSVYVEGQLDTPVNGAMAIVWNNSWPHHNQIFYTNSSGKYSGWFRVIDSMGILSAAVQDCHGDTIAHQGNYTHYGDSIFYSHVYCPVITPCSGFTANFYFSVVGNNVYTSNASSSSANKYRWNFGDGGTSSSKNPGHSYTPVDSTYTVCLIAQDTINGCSDTICKNVSINAKSTIFGFVTMDSTINPIDSSRCIIWLIKADSVGSDILLTAIDSVFLSDSGVYSFTNVANGRYLVKAALLSTSIYYTNYLPTYHNQSGLWSGANNVNVTSPNSFVQADITLIKGTNPGGPGFIGGLVSVGANKVGDPIEGIEVLLLNSSGVPVVYTYTDANGEYEFTNLAFGTYRVLIEIPGKPSEEYSVTLNQTSPGSSNNNFDVNSKNIKKSTTSSIGDVAKNELNMYPNPASSTVIILFEAAQQENAVISITDVTGKEVLNSSYALNEGKNNIDLDVKSINNGLYIVTVTTGAGSYTGRITIRR